MSNIGNIFRSMQRPVDPVHTNDSGSTSGSRPSPPPSPRGRGGSVPPQLSGLGPRLQRTPLRNEDAGSDDEFFDAADHFEPEQTPPPEQPAAPPRMAGSARQATVADVAHTMPHPARKRESTQISSFFTRTQVKPGRGMHLPSSGSTLAPAPAAQRGAPSAPPAGKPLDKGILNSDHKKMQKTMRTAVTQIAPELPKPAMSDRPAESLAALHDAGAMREHVAGLFGAGPHALGSQVAGDTLTTALHAALEHPAPHPGAGPVDTPDLSFPYSQHLMVAEHLAQACGGNALHAAEALEVLSSAPHMEQMLQGLASGRLAGPQLDALRAATGLAQTAPGFRALMTMMQPPMAPERQAGFQRLLTAVDKVAREGAATHGASALSGAASRAALKVGGRHAQTTLAETVLTIEMRIHTAPHVAGAASPYAALSPADKGAVFAWKNGFRDSGPGTELSKVQGRLAKMGKYVARAAKHERNASVAFNAKNPLKNGKFVKARAKMVAASVNQVFGKKKSPLTPFRAMGVNNAGQGHPDDNITKLDSTVATAMSELSAHLEAQLPAAGTPAHADMVRNLAAPRQPLPPQLEQVALMNYVQRAMEHTRPLGHELGKEALMQVAIDIADHHGTPDATAAIAAKLSAWEGKSITLQHLKQWAGASGLAEMQPAPAGAVTAQQETNFGKALRQASTIDDPATDRPRDMTPEGAHQYVRTFVQEHTWGGVVTAASGGTAGFNFAPLSVPIKKLSGALTKALTGVKASVAPVADVRGTGARAAVLSVGTSHHGGELFVGTQRQYAGAFGGGMTASVRKGLGKLFSVQGGGQGTVTPLAGDKSYTRGVMVRTSRPENLDGQTFNSARARDELTQFVDAMFTMAKGEGGGNLSPAATWEKLASEFLESDTLSIGWQHQTGETLRHTAAASVNARASVVAHDDPFETVGAGVSAGVSVDWASAANNKRTESTGNVRMVRNNHLSRLQVNGTLGMTTTAPSIPVEDGKGEMVTPPGGGEAREVGADPTSEALNMITPLAARQANYSLVDQGMNVTFRSVIEAGRLSETYTLREVEHRDAQHFKALLTEPSRQAQFEKVFEAVHGPAEAKHELDKFVAKLDNWAGPGQHYTLRSRLRADVRKGLDESAALASAIHRRDPHDPRLKELSAHMMSKLSDENSWVPMQIQAFEAQTASDVAGLNFGLVLTANHSVSSDRELYATAAPPNVVRAWAAEPRPPAPEHGAEGA
ncbi:hypothetical protein FHW83_003471 [Duganella sp. SG902]|uniref:hypothetical protein n=1 Tax=Duganella sp. SG902 TaxID=2587016 RepID=UPI00159D8C18|nr:hypothetical protein [Duganella sp. SG902]NVM77653.1 hypothetical protein [Duganella sp. SG902]